MSELTAIVQSAIDRFNGGDPAALNDIFSRSAGRLEQIARRILHGKFEDIASKEQTADIVQQCSLRLLRALEEVRVNSPTEFFRLSAEMIRRALLDLLDYHNGKKRSAPSRANVPMDGNSSAPGIVTPDVKTPAPDKVAALKEVHECVETLPDELRAVVDLLMYQGLTLPEAAEMLGVSVPIVKGRWKKAKLALAELLGDDLHEVL